jgi:hypothetical protein
MVGNGQIDLELGLAARVSFFIFAKNERGRMREYL